MADDSMFPSDRFGSLLPETERLHDDLEQSISAMSCAPRTSREFGAPLVLHQFFPAWAVQAYVRMAALPLHVHNSRYPLYEATGELPQLSDGNFLVPNNEIVQHLQSFHHDLDSTLSLRDKSESFAFRSMVTEKLQRVMLFCRWVDPITYKEITRPQLKKHIPFPLNYMLPKKMHISFIKTLQDSGLHTKEQAYVIARDCYTALNAKLAEVADSNSSATSPFFFGERPSALDAVVFGHIADAMGDPQLSAAVHQYAPLLITHAEMVRDRYFAMESDDSKRPRALSVEQLQASYYSHNQENFFTSQGVAVGTGSTDAASASFMKKVSPARQLTFLEPYRSLNWSRRELWRDVTAEKKARAQAERDNARANGGEDATAGSSWYSAPHGESFEKSTRNVIIGAVAAILLYSFANLPVQFRFVDDEEEEEEEEYEVDDEYDDEDGDDYVDYDDDGFEDE